MHKFIPSDDFKQYLHYKSLVGEELNRYKYCKYIQASMDYRTKNLEKVKEYQLEYFKKNNKFEYCEYCCCKVSSFNKKLHEQTKKHIAKKEFFDNQV